MSQLPREKIALVVFMACIVLIGAGIATYLVWGHSWNYAASRIDDAAGEMEGYTVVLYEGVSIPQGSRVQQDGTLAFTPVSMEAAKRDYEEKGAWVYTLDLVHPQRYDTPLIIGGGGFQIGVLNVIAGEPPAHIQAKVDYLARHEVGTVLAITPSQASLSQVEGIDVYIDLNETSPLATGTSSADGYRIATAEVGAVQALVISPSEVVSARKIVD